MNLTEPLIEFKIPIDIVRLKSSGDAAVGTFSGYASTWTKDLEGDTIQAGAFAQSIVDRKGKVPILWGHDSRSFLGTSTSLVEDHKGLLLQGALVMDSSAGKDAYAVLKHAQENDFRMGMSIGFITEEQEWDATGNSRTIKKVDLWEVSLTAFPANPRAYVDQAKSLRSFEKRLRDVGGFSAGEAKKILSLFSSLPTAGGPAVPQSAPGRDVRGERQISTNQILGAFHART